MKVAENKGFPGTKKPLHPANLPGKFFKLFPSDIFLLLYFFNDRFVCPFSGCSHLNLEQSLIYWSCRLLHRCFTVKFAKFFKATLLKTTCEPLLTQKQRQNYVLLSS